MLCYFAVAKILVAGGDN